jgi:hypothetical protein
MRRFKAKQDELKANLENGTNEEPVITPRGRKKKDESEAAGGELCSFSFVESSAN